MPVELTTARLTLRPLTIDDLAAKMEIEANENHRKYLGGTDNPERAQTLLQETIAAFGERGGLLGIVMRDDPATGIVGYCGLVPAQMDRADVEIVCAIKESHWGRRIAGEAASEVLAWAGRLSIRRMLGRVAQGNERSAKLVARLGMKPIGTRHDWFTGHDETVFAIETERRSA